MDALVLVDFEAVILDEDALCNRVDRTSLLFLWRFGLLSTFLSSGSLMSFIYPTQKIMFHILVRRLLSSVFSTCIDAQIYGIN